MTTPDVPHRMELTVELPAPAEAVWHAIATRGGLTSWFLRTEIDGRTGGRIVFYMGEGESSEGEVTDWSPPRRLEYAEPGWAALGGRTGADVTPLVSEFLIEARSGGTSVLRVVSSAFGTGADWEQEFFDGMEAGWRPFFNHLELYLSDFAGQEATAVVEAGRPVGAGPDSTWAALVDGLGELAPGGPVSVRGLSGRVHRLTETQVLVRLTDPYPGFAALWAAPSPDGTSYAQAYAYLFSPDARAYAEAEGKGWQAWLDALPLPSPEDHG
jgi:uncharacterized protein YndB with AHSA1/START domain